MVDGQQRLPAAAHPIEKSLKMNCNHETRRSDQHWRYDVLRSAACAVSYCLIAPHLRWDIKRYEGDGTCDVVHIVQTIVNK